jgi:hypothetical protein
MFMANRERWVGFLHVFHCIRTVVLRARNALPLLRYLESLVPGMAVRRANGVALFVLVLPVHSRIAYASCFSATCKRLDKNALWTDQFGELTAILAVPGIL